MQHAFDGVSTGQTSTIVTDLVTQHLGREQRMERTPWYFEQLMR
jgi:hypothetical protein